jgi:hypothetical protein
LDGVLDDAELCVERRVRLRLIRSSYSLFGSLKAAGSISAHQRLAAVFDIGNTSSSLQRIGVFLQAADGSTTMGCNFRIPAGSPVRLCHRPCSHGRRDLPVVSGVPRQRVRLGATDNVAISR